MLKKAQEELDIQVGRERPVDESDIKNLVYHQAIIKETLRLYPAGLLLGPREVMNDCTIAGHHVPVGTRLIVNVWKIQRDTRVWSNPSTFLPKRFLTSHVDVDARAFELANPLDQPVDMIESPSLTFLKPLHWRFYLSLVSQLMSMPHNQGMEDN
ncbi:hypothetical protein REPUB_Repub19eG0037300 [Reevesia pubescens]